MSAEEFATTTQDDDWKEELVRGYVRRFPPPFVPHGLACSQVLWFVSEHAKSRGMGSTAIGSGLIVAQNPDSVLAPDVQHFSSARPPDTRTGWPAVPPALVAEVVNDPADREYIAGKVPMFLAFGVDLVWVVDPESESVTVHRMGREPVVLATTDVLDGGDVLPGFSCKVADLFD
jgi:Uma2 family endonuclease